MNLLLPLMKIFPKGFSKGVLWTFGIKPLTMNCSPTIAIALLLLSLTAGTLLLYKTQKENLNTFFKVVAWFVIVVSFCSMICCTLRCVMLGCMMRQECREMEGCERGMSMGECGMGHGGMMRRMMIMRGGEECEMGMGCCKNKMECSEGRGECEEGKGECKDGEKKCCDKDGKKCDPDSHREKKDSVTVVVKKK